MHIPRILHFIWVGPPMPDIVRGRIARWKAEHPTWEIRVADERLRDLLPPFLREHWDNADNIVPPDAVGQFRADLGRYQLLHEYGGMYVDCDTFPTKNIEPALEGRKIFAAWEAQNQWVGNTYLGSIAGHGFWWRVQRQIDKNIRNRRGVTRPNVLCGPKMITPLWRRWIDEQPAPEKLWYPYSYRHVINGKIPGISDEAYAVHRWQHTRDVIDGRKTTQTRTETHGRSDRFRGARQTRRAHNRANRENSL